MCAYVCVQYHAFLLSNKPLSFLFTTAAVWSLTASSLFAKVSPEIPSVLNYLTDSAVSHAYQWLPFTHSGFEKHITVFFLQRNNVLLIPLSRVWIELE